MASSASTVVAWLGLVASRLRLVASRLGLVRVDAGAMMAWLRLVAGGLGFVGVCAGTVRIKMRKCERSRWSWERNSRTCKAVFVCMNWCAANEPK